MTSSRFDIYVKAGADGKSIGDCPFCQRVLMCANLKIPKDQVNIITVDVTNKPEEFLKLNPEGKVPVLVDNETKRVLVDSGVISTFINDEFPTHDLQNGYDGPAVKASSGVFRKLAALLKTKDADAIPQLKRDLETELKTLDEYLKCEDCKGQFLVTDSLCDLDCSILPKLRHVEVAGKHFRDFDIPPECASLLKYIAAGQSSPSFKQTCPTDQDIITGWSRHAVKCI